MLVIKVNFTTMFYLSNTWNIQQKNKPNYAKLHTWQLKQVLKCDLIFKTFKLKILFFGDNLKNFVKEVDKV